MVELLLAKSANPDEMDDDKISALSSAVIGNHLSPTGALLKRGPDVNHVNNMGMTPLLYAASIDFGDSAVLESLIAARSDLNAKDKQGRTALTLAKTYTHIHAVNLLNRAASN